VTDLMSFETQAKLLAETDVFITIHGAAIMNSMFMRPGSVVIDVFNGRFLEFIFETTLREMGVKLQYLAVWDNQKSNVTDCAPYPEKCVQSTVSYGNDLECLGLRSCSLDIDILALQESLYEAYHHVLSVKWLGDH
jgi:Glycosyltransferase 61